MHTLTEGKAQQEAGSMEEYTHMVVLPSGMLQR